MSDEDRPGSRCWGEGGGLDRFQFGLIYLNPRCLVGGLVG